MSSKITAFGVPGGIRRMATLKGGDDLRSMSLRPLRDRPADLELSAQTLKTVS
jgi:hypothetical protein